MVQPLVDNVIRVFCLASVILPSAEAKTTGMRLRSAWAYTDVRTPTPAMSEVVWMNESTVSCSKFGLTMKVSNPGLL